MSLTALANAASASTTPPSSTAASLVSLASASSVSSARSIATSAAAARPALRPRDRNAPLTARPPSTPRLASFCAPASASPSCSRLPVMGYDKDTPRKPTLAARPVVRAPLTPKIAVPSSASTASTASGGRATPTHVSSTTSPYQTVTVSTPLARRAHPHAHANDVASPVPAYLHNITPRSGSRQSRVDGSAASTPPALGAGAAVGSGPGIARPGSAASSAVDPDVKFFYASDAKSTVASSPANGAGAPAPPAVALPARASTFFYASGQSRQPQAPLQPLASPALSSSGAASPPDAAFPKFVHANGTALEPPPPPPKRASTASVASPRAPTPLASASAASQSRPRSPAKAAAVAPPAPFPLQRSVTFPAQGSSSSPASTYSPPPSGPASPSGLHGPRPDVLLRQRSNFGASISSIGSNGSTSPVDAGRRHSRQGSLTIADPPTVARLLQSSQPSSETSSPASLQCASFPSPTSNGTAHTASTAATSGLAAILQAADDFTEADTASEKTAPDGPHGEAAAAAPSSSQPDPSVPPPPPNPVDALVANARRERKVQDLEITNASLEAINRSLERQLRKQKSELRQFRRLSRSGRLSLAVPLPSASVSGGGDDDDDDDDDGGDDALAGMRGGPGRASGVGSRMASSSTVHGPLQDTDRMLSGLSDDDDLDLDLDGFDDGSLDDLSDMEASFREDDNGGNGDGVNSFDYGDSDDDADERRRRRTRARDERRLQLDLAKHRQLLVDSQKINQSIKRCMGWTEALIQEGRKALAFQVRVSDVQLGGRVLAADEVEEREERKRAAEQAEQAEQAVQAAHEAREARVREQLALSEHRLDSEFSELNEMARQPEALAEGGLYKVGNGAASGTGGNATQAPRSVHFDTEGTVGADMAADPAAPRATGTNSTDGVNSVRRTEQPPPDAFTATPAASLTAAVT